MYVTYFEKLLPARSAFGAAGLAFGARVEIECMVEGQIWVNTDLKQKTGDGKAFTELAEFLP